MDKYEHLVYVECMTYNQRYYIEDTLRGFVIQRTNFPFVCMIMDDASTDGEQDILRSFLGQEFDLTTADKFATDEAETIVAKHNVNDNCTFIVCLLKENHLSTGRDKAHLLSKWRDNSKYIAMCEGDDYWTDSNKLQKQVEFLEENPDYSMCFHNAMSHWEDGSCEDKLFSDVENRDYSGKEIFVKWTIPTASVVMRRSVLQSEYYKKLEVNPNFCYGDILMFISAAHSGKIRGMDFTGSVYRRHRDSMVFKLSDRPCFFHNYEIYKTIGGEYKEHARKLFFNNAFSILAGNYDKDLKKMAMIACLKTNPFKTMWRTILLLRRK